MKLKIVRIEKDLPLPEYQTTGAVAFDFYTRIDTEIKPKETKLVPTNLIIEVPEGHMLMIAARSSTVKRGLFKANSVGIVDQDYNGPKDEIGVLLYNFSEETAILKRGDRIAQGLIIPIQKVTWEEVDVIKAESRGGFGSTGKNV